MKKIFKLGLSFGIVLSLISGCGVRLPSLGLEGKYRMGRSLYTKPQKAGVSEAIPYLEEVAKKDPYHKDTLTLLGRAYYDRKRYQEALWVLTKSLEINRQDEIAWATLGITQLQLGEDGKGMESLQNGLVLLNKAAKSGYRGYLNWDPNSLVRNQIRKTILQIAEEGLNGKEQIIRSTENLLTRVDNEERAQLGDQAVERTIQKGDQ
jgi:tetratricopeptide (TPR) repeat protein